MNKLKAILSGKIESYEKESATIYKSGYKKVKIEGKVKISKFGLINDEQADKKHHGGADKAILAYSLENYQNFKDEMNLNLEFGSFGENFVISNLNEESVNLGDIYQIGEILVEITQTRQPCWKISKFLNSEILKQVVKNNRTGWYFKVLKDGEIESGIEVKLKERKCDISIFKSIEILHNPKEFKTLVEKIVNYPFVADSYKNDLLKKLNS